MFWRFKLYLSIFFVIVGVYLFINVEVILWDYLDPDGFWGLLWFYITSFIILAAFLGVLNFLEMAVMLRRTERIELWSLLLIGLFFLLGSVIYIGPTILIARALKDRYKYIERSEKYFSEGKFDDAVQYAEKVYKKSNLNKHSSPVLLLPYLLDNSKYGIKRKTIRFYQASINYAICLQSSGKDINKAEQYFLKCKEIAITYFQNEPEYRILPIMGLAKIYMAKGDNLNVERTYLELTKLQSRLDKSDIINKIQTLIYYSNYATKIGDFERASKLRQQVLSVYENSQESKESINYLALLLPVASDYLNNDIGSAEYLLSKAKIIAKKNKPDLLYVNYLIIYARLLEIKGQLKESETTFIDVIDQIKERQGPEHIQYAQSLASLASFYYRYGQVNRASYYFNKSLALMQRFSYFQDYYTILLGSALADYSTHKYQSSLNKIDIIKNYLFAQINESFRLLTEEEKEVYISFMEKQFNLINKIYVSLNDTAFNGKIYDNVIAIKGIALQSNQYLKNYIQTSNQLDLLKSYNYLQSKKEQVTKLRISGTINDDLISRIQDSINFTEKQFLTKLEQTSNYEYFKVNSITWKDVRKGLKVNETAIEYFSVPSSLSNVSDAKYFALVLKPNLPTPILIPLFQETTIIKILNQKGTSRERINKIYSGISFQILYDNIWQPIQKYISGSTRVYVSLSGILNQISFPALTIDEKYDIIYYSSTRKLAYTNNPVSNNTLATLYGGINYNDIQRSYFGSINSTSNFSVESKLQDILRSENQQLPSTKDEIEGIASLLSRKSYDTVLFTGIHATKSSFKNLTYKQPKILHIATHGFYYSPEQSYRINELLFGTLKVTSTFESPLFRSGLLFAGANQIKKKGEVDNGILTAFEISKLDLSKVDLVVLSACETGLGDIKGGEGVYGLQRAFKLAGVNSIVASLWKVPDKQTSELMKEFYSFYLSGKTKQQALKEAQKGIMKSDPNNPFNWAAFVIIE